MNRDGILEKLNSQPGYLANHFIVGHAVGALYDDNDGRYSAYYWYDVNKFNDKITYRGSDKDATEVFNAFKTLYKTMYKVAKEGAAKRVQVKLPLIGVVTPGILVTLLTSLVGLFFSVSLIDYLAIKMGSNKDKNGPGDNLRKIIEKEITPMPNGDKKSVEMELLTRVGILAIFAAIAGTSYRLDKNYKDALNTLAKYKVVRFSTITGLVTNARVITEKEVKKMKKEAEEDEKLSSIAKNFGAADGKTDEQLNNEYPGFKELSKNQKKNIKTMINNNNSKSDIMKKIQEFKNNKGEKEDKKADVNYFSDQIGIFISNTFKDKWTKVFIAAGAILASFILLDFIRGNRTEQEAAETSKWYNRITWFKSLFDRAFKKFG